MLENFSDASYSPIAALRFQLDPKTPEQLLFIGKCFRNRNKCCLSPGSFVTVVSYILCELLTWTVVMIGIYLPIEASGFENVSLYLEISSRNKGGSVRVLSIREEDKAVSTGRVKCNNSYGKAQSIHC